MIELIGEFGKEINESRFAIYEKFRSDQSTSRVKFKKRAFL